MAAGYTRQSASQIASGQQANLSAPYNNEFNQLESFASGASGHDHSGGTGLGPTLTRSALAGFGSNTGVVVATSASLFAARTITGTTGEITVTNGTGVSGNPTLSLPTNLVFTGKTITGGTFDGITVSGGGVSGGAGSFTTLAASSATTLSTSLTVGTTLGVTGVSTLAGMTATTGSFSSTLAATGNFSVNTNKFNVTAASGNTTVAGTLGVTGASTFSSTLGVTGDFTVNTSNFTVTASSGNTAVGGTLTVASTANVVSNFSVATNKFNVTAASGNTTVAGTLGVTGATTAAGITSSGVVAAVSYTASSSTLGYQAAASGFFYWLGRSNLSSPSDGIITLANDAGTAFTRLQLGGTTASFPAIKRNTTAINFRLADDSAYAPIATSIISLNDGTAALPALAFNSAANLGIYRPTTNVLGISAAGLDVCKFIGKASTVNYATISSDITGTGPTISVDGTDANSGIYVVAKGNGSVILKTSSGPVLSADYTASGVNYFTMASGAAGTYASMTIQGGDTNTGYIWNAAGTGAWFFKNGGGSTRFTILGDGSFISNGLAATIDPSVGSTDGVSFNAANNISTHSNNGNHSFEVRRRASDGAVMRFWRDTTAVGTITVTSSTTAYNTSSDRRLKINIENFDKSANYIDNLQPVTFNWKSTKEEAIGLIAQDAYRVYPQAVTHDEQYDSWAIDFSKFVPLLIAEVKSLRARVAKLEGSK